MRITKFGHCCLLIEHDGKRMLTDPGVFTTQQNDALHLDLVLITHEHADHFHLESLKCVLEKNPRAQVVTNAAVAALLEQEGIACHVMRDGDARAECGIPLAAIGTEHAVIMEGVPVVENTGFFIADILWYPGDAFTYPKRAVDVLALPVAGPWMKMSEALSYAKKLQPKTAFPVHDGILLKPTMFHPQLQKALEKNGIRFVSLGAGDTLDV